MISEVHYNPSPPPAIAAEDFSSGTADDFTPLLGTWNVRDGGYEVTPGVEGDTLATLSTDGPLPAEFVLSATLNIRTVPDFNQNAVLFFDYYSPTDFKFVSVHAGSDKWRIGQRDASGWNFLASKVKTIEADTDLEVVIEIRGSLVTLRSGGVLVLDHDFGAALSDGQVGLGSKNGTPRFEKVQLEGMGDPQDSEFLELVGTTAAPVDLGGWRLNDGVTMTFAPGTILGPGQVFVLVGFDPGETGRAELVRKVLGIEESVVLVGPYEGRLSNTGEVVSLTRPAVLGDPQTGFVLVDRVHYDEQPPWPTQADGAGRALSRASEKAFGSFATSWSALEPTPGTVRFAETGDVAFDGETDGNDVVGFARVLADPAVHQLAYGVPATLVADVDGDGDVDFDDIDDFVALLAGNAASAAVQAGAEPDRVSRRATRAASRVERMAPLTVSLQRPDARSFRSARLQQRDALARRQPAVAERNPNPRRPVASDLTSQRPAGTRRHARVRHAQGALAVDPRRHLDDSREGLTDRAMATESAWRSGHWLY
jgi:hypothetical protein